MPTIARGSTGRTVTPAGLLALVPDWPAETAYWRQLCREAWADAYERGYRDGFERGARQLEATWPVIAEPALRRRPDYAEIEARRLLVCCRRCRRHGHRPGCPDCASRDRATAGSAHRDDYGGKHG
ncbi:MAG TPA: hypothetical protein VFE59_21165 [Trebonia sp.]|jgi:hypothetical protein|nr:hypothetical protein [Trebonia sp.]